MENSEPGIRNPELNNRAQEPDWNAIKREYISSEISLRALASKHEVSLKALSRRCSDQKWVKARQRARDKATTRIVNNSAKRAASLRNRIYTTAEKMLDKLDLVADAMKVDDLKDVKNVREVTGALRDLRAVLDVKSEQDLEEQRARIDKMKREAEAPGIGDGGVTVSFEGEEADEWSG